MTHGASGTLWTGGCLCGAVRHAARGAPDRVVHCHCHLCRRQSGAAFLTLARFRRGAVSFTRGAPTPYRGP